MTHTPTPWVALHKTGIFAPDNTALSIATVERHRPEHADNRDLIIRAVNAHADLVAALEDIAEKAGHRYDGWRCVEIARDALAKARGESS